MIEEIVVLMKQKKEENDFISYTLNIVYDSICEIIKICQKLPIDISNYFREVIIKELKNFSNNHISEEMLVSNSIKSLKSKLFNSKIISNNN